MNKLGFHLLLLLLIPVIWHMIKHSSMEWPRPAGSEAQGEPLTDVEQDYYDKVFNYTMQNITANTPYDWRVGKSFGRIKAGTSFISKLHAYCRPYGELYTINDVPGSAEGYSCRRVDDEDPPSWCKLGVNEALTCAIEKNDLMDTITNSLR